MSSREPLSNPGVHFPPPLLFVVGLLVAGILDRYVYALPLSPVLGVTLLPIAWALLALGIAIAAWGMLTFRRAATAIIPHQSARLLVTDGPYRFTRNPMYTGMTLAYLGGAALLDSAWPVVVLPLVLIALVRTVISREEAYLSDAFGAEYAAYMGRVRRWV